ncbi:MAG: hypothetical protein VB137_04675 [Burkholderia sp.]
MREHGLLSPHRQPQKPPNAHDGRMTTDRPTLRRGCIGIHTSPKWATALPHWS